MISLNFLKGVNELLSRPLAPDDGFPIAKVKRDINHKLMMN